MIFYRRNTVSDKIASMMGMMLAIILMYNSVQRFQILGNLSAADVFVAAIGFAVGIVFLYTSRFKYIEITEDTLVWYTWFWKKHTLHKSEIKDIETKQRYLIISRHQKSAIWLSKTYIRREDDQEVNERLKKLIGG